MLSPRYWDREGCGTLGNNIAPSREARGREAESCNVAGHGARHARSTILSWEKLQNTELFLTLDSYSAWRTVLQARTHVE